ncbi:hypothetical protein QYM36_012712, partial [Artemia franciscana]
VVNGNAQCKVCDSDRSAFSSSVEKVIDNSLRKLRKDLKVDLKESLADFSNDVKEIQFQLSSKCSTQDVRNIVHETISSTNPSFAAEVRKVIRSEQDREKRRLNIIVYGIVPANDETDIITHIIRSSYDLDPGPITNVRRLNASTSRPSTTSQPALLLFSVSWWDIKKKILQISKQRKECPFSYVVSDVTLSSYPSCVSPADSGLLSELSCSYHTAVSMNAYVGPHSAEPLIEGSETHPQCSEALSNPGRKRRFLKEMYSNLDCITNKLPELPEETLIVGNIYQSPSAPNANDSHQVVADLVSKIASSSSNFVFITGDFNMPDVIWVDGYGFTTPNNPAQKTLNSVANLALNQLIDQQTHYGDGQNTNKLDLVFTNNHDTVTSLKYLPAIGSSDHNCVMFSMLVSTRPSNMIKRSYTDYDEIREHLSEIDWQLLTVSDNGDDSWFNFKSCLLAVDKQFASITYTEKTKTQNQVTI